MWQSILDACGQSQGSVERLQEITDQVSHVLVSYKSLMSKSCCLVSLDQDQGSGQYKIILSEVLSPLFGFEGQAVACLLKVEAGSSDAKDFQPFDLPAEPPDMGSDWLNRQEDTKFHQEQLVVEPLISDFKPDPDGVPATGYPDYLEHYGSPNLSVNPPARPKKSKQVSKPRKPNKAGGFKMSGGYNEPVQYDPNYPIDEETFNKIMSNAIPPKCDQCQRTYNKKYSLFKHWKKDKNCKTTNVILGRYGHYQVFK